MRMSEELSTVRKIKQCPECHANMPVDMGFVTWCDHCNWNLQPGGTEPPEGLLATIYDRFSKRFSHGLYKSVINQSTLQPRFTISKALAFLVAGLVFLTAILLLVAGLTLLVAGWPNIIAIIGGVFFLLIAWSNRPRFGKVPPNIAAREDFPALYELVDTINDVLGGREVYALVIEPFFNAAFSQVSIRRRQIIHIGLPLFTVLNAQERVAVLAHELAHGVNGDPLRGLFLGSAVNNLINWYYIIRPERIWQPYGASLVGFLLSMLMVPINLGLGALSEVFKVMIYGFLFLVYRESQRAEYYADYLATTVSGTSALVETLTKFSLYNSVDLAIRRARLTKNKENLYDVIQAHVSQIPQRELERLRRISLLESGKVDDTHPPTPYRMEIIKQRLVETPAVCPSTLEMEKIDFELRAAWSKQLPGSSTLH